MNKVGRERSVKRELGLMAATLFTMVGIGIFATVGAATDAAQVEF